MEKNRSELNNLLLDKQYDSDGVSLKKMIFLGLVLFGISVGVFFSIKLLNEDSGFDENLVEPSILEQDSIKKSNPSLFKDVNDKKLESSQKTDTPNKEIQKVSNGLIEQLMSQNKKDKEVLIEKNKQIKQPIVTKPPQDLRNIGKETKQPATRKTNKKVTTNIKRGFYVQVGAFYEQLPDDVLLGKLARKNYTHSLYKIKLNNKNVTKVLIGPYETKNDALRQLSDIKTIEKDAYILKMN